MYLRLIDVKKYSYWQFRFEKYREFILEKYKTHRNIKNYQFSRLNLKDILGLFVVYDETKNRIAGFTSVFTPRIWPHNIARISNRLWVDPDYRLKGLSLTGYERNLRYGSNWGVTITYKHQINCCRKNKIDMAVITRENKKVLTDGNSLPFLYSRFKKLKPEWKLSDKYYLTCNNRVDYRCWQRLIYLELRKNTAKILLAAVPSMTSEVYYKKFG